MRVGRSKSRQLRARVAEAPGARQSFDAEGGRLGGKSTPRERGVIIVDAPKRRRRVAACQGAFCLVDRGNLRRERGSGRD